MCLALLAFAAHPDYALVVAANRDEYHARPAQPSHWWDEGWLAGRDLSAGGTWLGMTRSGRWALVTNVREAGRYDPQAPSRGQLVPQFLQGTGSVEDGVRAIVAGGDRHNGFNLLAGDRDAACWGSNRAATTRLLSPGVYGLSNLELDTPWPKVRRLKHALSRWCAGTNDSASLEPLFDLLADRTIAPDAELPATGITLERERMLSAPFIVSTTYGTRNSTVLAIGYDDNVRWIERTFDSAGERQAEVTMDFRLVKASSASPDARFPLPRTPHRTA